MIFSQTRLTNKIRAYLINRGRNELAESLSPGYCYGLALYFCDMAARHELDSFYALLTAVAMWEEKDDQALLDKINDLNASEEWKNTYNKLTATITDMPIHAHTTLADKVHWARKKKKISPEEENLLLRATLPDDPSIEKLLNKIEWLQEKYKLITISNKHPGKTKVWTDTKKMDFLHTPDTKDHKNRGGVGFATAMLIPVDQLTIMLEKLPVDRSIQLGNGRHGFSCYRTKEGWYFYDSNNDTRTPLRTTVEEFSKDILSMYGKTIKASHIPLGVLIFSKKIPDDFDYSELTACCDQFISSENILQAVSEFQDNYPWDRVNPITIAIQMGISFEIIKKIIDHNQHLNFPDSIGLSPLHYATFFKRYDVIEYLIEKNTRINQPIYREDNMLDDDTKSLFLSLQNATPLHVAVLNNDMEMVKFLLTKGADINAKTTAGLTPISMAAKKGNIQMLTLLVQEKADLSKRPSISNDIRSDLRLKTDKKITALEYFGAFDLTNLNDDSNLAMIAATYDQNDAVQVLLDNGIDINAKIGQDATLLHIAMQVNNLPLLEILLNRGADIHSLIQINFRHDNHQIDALGLACILEKPAFVKAILAHRRLSPEPIQNPKMTPAMVIALENGNAELIFLLQSDDPEQLALSTTEVSLDLAAKNAYFLKAIKLLEKILANPHAIKLDSLLELAIKENDIDFVKRLVREKKVAVNADSMLLAKRYVRPEIARLFLESGCDVFARDEDGMSIVKVCLNEQFTTQVLIDSFKQENLANLNKVDAAGNSLIHHSILDYRNQALETALELGANPNLINKEGIIPLAVAINKSNDVAIKLLLKHGAQITMCLSNGFTPFANILNRNIPNQLELVELFLQRGAKVTDTRNGEENSDTVFAYLIRNITARSITNGYDIVELFLKNGADVNDKLFGAPLIELVNHLNDDRLKQIFNKHTAEKRQTETNPARMFHHNKSDDEVKPSDTLENKK